MVISSSVPFSVRDGFPGCVVTHWIEESPVSPSLGAVYETILSCHLVVTCLVG